MATIQQLARQNEKRRINELLAQDEISNSQSDRLYRQALTMIRDNLQDFYMQYAGETGLSLAQTRHAITGWDMQQWKKAVNSVDMVSWDDEAKYQAGKYSYQAGHDRTNMIDAIIGLAVVDMTANMRQLINDRLTTDQASQIKHLEVNLEQYLDRKVKTPLIYELPTKSTAKSVITQQETRNLWSDQLWLNSQEMANDVQTLVNKHLRHGMDLKDMQGMLAEHVNPKQFRPRQSLADRMKQVDYSTQRIIRTESARLIDEVNMSTYRLNGVSMVQWVNEPGACEKCQAIADQGPYTLAGVPSIPGDTHPNCRCSKIPFVY
ncbi:hypothetical protein [Levilactobacillus brevis]|uniref:hypothetical protein n=1 Tax=Levilactobacillus brevis TaxID=1580 RepID=UPI002072CA64|nr:hypothetical protein [Levilactobacillus brevis]